MWQARGGQHQNTRITGRIFSKPCSCMSNLARHSASSIALLSRMGASTGGIAVGSPTHFSFSFSFYTLQFGKNPPRFDGVHLTVVNSASKASFLRQEAASPSGRPPGSKAGGKWLLPGSGDLLMQIAEKWQLPPFRLGMCTAEEPFRSSGLIGPIQRELLGGARKHDHKLRVDRWRPRLLAARRERIC